MPALALALTGDIDGTSNASHHDEHIAPPSPWHYQASPPDDIAAAEIHGLLYRRHLLKNSAGFLETEARDIEASPLSVDMANGFEAKSRPTIPSELPTSLLMQSASLKTEPLHDPSADETELALGTSLAVPLMRHHAAHISTGFNPAWHDHYLANEFDPSLHDWAVDIKPLSMRQIARLMFAAVTNVMEHMLGPHFLVHAMFLLALAAIWAPYDKMAAAAVKGVPKLVGGVISGATALATGVYAVAEKAVEVTGKAMRKAAKATKKAAKAVGKAVGKAAKATVKAIGKGADALASGIASGAEHLWNNIPGLGDVDLGKALESAAKGLRDSADSAGRSIGKGFKGFGNWVGGITGPTFPVIGASLAWVGQAFKSFGKFVGKAAKKGWKATKWVAKKAWKGTKFVAKGLWKGAKLVGKGLANLYDLLDRAVKATGRGILALGNLARGITGKHLGAALLIGAALGVGALLAVHALRKRNKGRSTMTWGGKKRGRAGRKGNPVDARAAALQAAEEREAARKRKKKGTISDAPVAAEPPRTYAATPRKTRKKKQLTMDDLLAKQRRDINNAYASDMYGPEENETNMTPLGKHSVAAAAAAGGAAMIANSMSGPRSKQGSRGATGHEFAAGDETEEIPVQPGPVVIGHKSRSWRMPSMRRRTQVDAKPHNPPPQRIPQLPRRHAEEGSSENGDTDEIVPGIPSSGKVKRTRTGKKQASVDKLAVGDEANVDERAKAALKGAEGDKPLTFQEKLAKSREKLKEDEDGEPLPDDVVTSDDMQEIDDMETEREQARRMAKEKENAPAVTYLATHNPEKARQLPRNKLARSPQEEEFARDMRYHNWHIKRVWPNPHNRTAPGVRRARPPDEEPVYRPPTPQHPTVTEVQPPSVDYEETRHAAWGSRAEQLVTARAVYPHQAERFQEEAEEDASRSRDDAQMAREQEVYKVSENEDMRERDERLPSRVPHNDAVLGVAAANRQHKPNTFDLKTVQNMDDDELQEFKEKEAFNNRAIAGAPVHAHDANHSGHRVSSSNLAFVLPKHSPGRASAFLGMTQDDIQAFCSMQGGSEFGDGALSSLYYIDQDGRPRDFLDPGKLKQSLRKLTIDSGLARASFLEPISEQRLRSS